METQFLYKVGLFSGQHFLPGLISIPQDSEWGHEEITRVPQTLQTGWQLWSPTNFTKSGPFLKVSTEGTMPVGGEA